VGRLRQLIPRFSLRTLVVFLLLVTSGVGLWWRRGAWRLQTEFFAFLPTHIQFSSDGKLVRVECPGDTDFTGGPSRSVWDATTGECLQWQNVNEVRSTERHEDTSPDGSRHCFYMRDGMLGDVVVADRASSTVLAVLSWGGMAPTHVLFSPDGGAVLLADDWGQVIIYRRRRPEWWWGVLWLWEFWLTVALAALFVWSVWRDRKALRKEAA